MSYTDEHEGREDTQPIGPEPQGFLIYTADPERDVIDLRAGNIKMSPLLRMNAPPRDQAGKRSNFLPAIAAR